MRSHLLGLFAVCLICTGAASCQTGAAQAPAAAPPRPQKVSPAAVPNVLFLVSDDLRPGAIGCFGNPTARTPNLDRLAQRGVVFSRAYCQQAVCSPSRSSLLTGRRPDTTKVWDLQTHFRAVLPDVVTLPQLFRQSGYVTAGIGKIYHPGYDDAPSWSEPSWLPNKVPNFGPDGQAAIAKQREQYKLAGKDVTKARGLPFEAPEVDDDKLTDGAIANQAVERLRRYKQEGKPFFLGVGFIKPHLPFVAPKKYWDLYKPEQFKVPANRELPKGAPPYAGNNSGELRAYLNIPEKGPVPDETALKLIHGYYASTSYMDAQLGRVLDELEKLGLAENTIIVFWGDHGWSLGEHGIWCKHTNYEDAARAPLIVSPARSSAAARLAGSTSDALVEFVDVYPTLAELCGLKMPPGLEGTSLVPLLTDPKRPWKQAAFSQYPRTIPQKGPGMGYSIRTDRYRLVEWRVKGEVVSYELYDHETDPAETINLAVDTFNAVTVKDLSSMLQDGWQKMRP